jgi:hypothetical protein
MLLPQMRHGFNGLCDPSTSGLAGMICCENASS